MSQILIRAPVLANCTLHSLNLSIVLISVLVCKLHIRLLNFWSSNAELVARVRSRLRHRWMSCPWVSSGSFEQWRPCWWHRCSPSLCFLSYIHTLPASQILLLPVRWRSSMGEVSSALLAQWWLSMEPTALCARSMSEPTDLVSAPLAAADSRVPC